MKGAKGLIRSPNCRGDYLNGRKYPSSETAQLRGARNKTRQSTVSFNILVLVMNSNMKGIQRYDRLKMGAFNGNTRSAMDSESVVSTIMSTTSNTTEAFFSDVLTADESNASLLHENKRRRSRKSRKRPQRRPRGISLERQILRLILRTASAGAAGAHFELGTSPHPAGPVCSPQDILKDLASDLELWNELLYFPRPERTLDDQAITKESVFAENPPILNDETSIHCTESRQQPDDNDPALTLLFSSKDTQQEQGIRDEPEALPGEELSMPEPIQSQNSDFVPIEPFDSVSWRNKSRALNPGTKQPTPTDSTSKTTVTCTQTRRESVVFKTNFEDWNKFEPDAFLPIQHSEPLLNSPMRGDSSLSMASIKARSGDPLKARKTMVPKKLPSPSSRRLPIVIFDGRSTESRAMMSPTSVQRKHSSFQDEYRGYRPESPYSIVDQGVTAGSTQFRRSIRVDPPASHIRQFHHTKVSRITI